MAEPEATQLLGCPFCGGEALLASYRSCDCCGKAWNGRVTCQGCGQEVSHFDTDAEAIEFWQTRSTTPDAVEAMRRKTVEEAARACEAQRAEFATPEYAGSQVMGSLAERFACDECALAIRALIDPKETDCG